MFLQGSKVASYMIGVYDSTKAALDALTRSMAVELGKYNIRVNSVNPTMFASDMSKNFLANNPDGGADFQKRVPLKRLVNPDEIVNTILFVLSNKAEMINASTLVIDGGYTAN